MYYNIIVARPFDQVFTYESNNQTLEVGQIVIVPFGKAMEVGMVMEVDIKKPDYTIKKIETVIIGIQLNEITIKFLKWVSDYTLAPLGSVLKLFIINKDIVGYERDDKTVSEPTFKSTVLNEEQGKAKEDIIKIQKSSNKPIVFGGCDRFGKNRGVF